jgi:CheY-like chemotaxis protein
VAVAKGLQLRVDLKPGLPDAITTDAQRLQQILRNLLSNAYKFTEAGEVVLEVRAVDPASGGAPGKAGVAFAVRDTGIGIPKEKHRVIFEAFQQADGSTNRKYGGTGLGLSISRELAHLLEGEIHVQSQPGAGSTFTLYLPLAPTPEGAPAAPELRAGSGEPPAILESATVPDVSWRQRARVEDDRARLDGSRPVVVIAAGEPSLATRVRDVARAEGFHAIVADDPEGALHAVREYAPAAAFVDLDLGGRRGWLILDELTSDPEARRVAVHALGNGPAGLRARVWGVRSAIEKPLQDDRLEAVLRDAARGAPRRLLLVGTDEAETRDLRGLAQGDEVEVAEARSAEEAKEALRASSFDCVAVGRGVQDARAADLLGWLDGDLAEAAPPVLLLGDDGAREDGPDPAPRHLVVRPVTSRERAIHEASVFLRLGARDVRPERRHLIHASARQDWRLVGRTVLVVDDDIRNVFAISSALEPHGLTIRHAENGRQCLEVLDTSVDIVLMDIMMPELDGYSTIAAIRERPEYEGLPIVALTAKAMKGDREKCLEAGASDYVTKPVDIDRLLSLLRVWIDS